MKIAITGGSGFIGKHVVELLLKENKHEFSLIGRNQNKFQDELISHYVYGDLTDVKSLTKAFKDCDVLINLAAEVREIAKMNLTNVDGAHNLVEAIGESTIKKVIHLSSVGVIGSSYNLNKTIINEKAIKNPSIPYEISKSTTEDILMNSLPKSIELIILRPTNVFGEFHPFDALLNLMQHIKKNKILLTSKDARVNYVYVKDLSFIILDSLDKSMENSIYNTGSSMSLVGFYKLLRVKLNSKSKIIVLPKVFFKILKFLSFSKLNAISNAVIYDGTRIAKEINFEYDIENGIEKTIQYFQNKNKL